MPWTDSTSFRENNCVAIDGTNGVDINAPDTSNAKRDTATLSTVSKFRQQPKISSADARKHALNVMLDVTPLQDISLPPALTPGGVVSGSLGVSEFHLLNDGKTGVLALGSFSEDDFDTFEQTLLTGLTNLKIMGATQLIVDVVGVFDSSMSCLRFTAPQSNNGGGFICIAHVSLSHLLYLIVSFKLVHY